ncbi:hypothetical protein ADU80_13420 [Clostridium botulinum]|uniref:Uncharacterized protein n=1 Tax=Clostridium botulinum TaxID=1491 RepID=A0A9Q1UX95_CLOBO|nr:hypothetical protein [Clostridium botulinum]AEB76366.1 hypothetical protein CbC4_1690 [Clostridium botulinum BKT015925]KEI04834.1 hypothetical protein Y848_11875 [Clostridium botulinum C/D str. Sp77]KOA75647.1 hypothetical protein ADU77_10890 [Clostridium botulinum]KOA82862.1 hypothetical protein ADU80_13420 [Clostridium botulinum]KOA84543.1 hypothetical protein ADU75_08890 [Clostridium botulinum]
MITNDNNIIISCSLQSSNSPAKYITVTNKGNYTASFNLSYKVGKRLYNDRSPKFAPGKSYMILYDAKASSLTLSAYCYDASDHSKLICKKKSSKPFTKCLSLGGTLPKPNCSEVSCSPINSIPPELPPQNPCCCSCCCCCCPKIFN